MARRTVAISCAAALVVLYAYQIMTAFKDGIGLQMLPAIGLGLALCLLLVEAWPAKKDRNPERDQQR